MFAKGMLAEDSNLTTDTVVLREPMVTATDVRTPTYARTAAGNEPTAEIALIYRMDRTMPTCVELAYLVLTAERSTATPTATVASTTRTEKAPPITASPTVQAPTRAARTALDDRGEDSHPLRLFSSSRPTRRRAIPTPPHTISL